jgi:hypothetical protein
MKFERFWMSYEGSRSGDDMVLREKAPDVRRQLTEFLAKDKMSINIRYMMVTDENVLMVFYDDILPPVEKNGDRFAGIEV